VLGYNFENLEAVEVEDDCSTCYSGIGRIESTNLSMSSHLSSAHWNGDDAINYCQCTEDDVLVQCLSCGSWFELDIHSPGC
jgi:hypothetical protein